MVSSERMEKELKSDEHFLRLFRQEQTGRDRIFPNRSCGLCAEVHGESVRLRQDIRLTGNGSMRTWI
jgi:hypothetical protein